MSGWELIGGDPAPGDPDACRRAAAVWDRIGQGGAAAGKQLAVLGSGGGVWSGSAAEAFHGHLAVLRPDLAAVAESYRLARDALTDYAGELEGLRIQARAALADADAAAGDQAAAERNADDQRAAAVAQTAVAVTASASADEARAAAAARALLLDSAGAASDNLAALAHDQRAATAGAAAREATRLADAAAAAARAAGQRLAEARRRADRIRRQHADAVATVVRRLRAASEAGIPNRPLLRVLGDDVRTAATDVARSPEFDQFLNALSDVGSALMDISCVLPIATAIALGVVGAVTVGPAGAVAGAMEGYEAGEGAAEAATAAGLALKGMSVAGRYAQRAAGRIDNKELVADNADLAISAASVVLGGPKISRDFGGVFKRDLAFDDNRVLSGVARQWLWHVPVAAKAATPSIARQVTYVGISGAQNVIAVKQTVDDGAALVGDLSRYHPSGSADSVHTVVTDAKSAARDEVLDMARERVWR